MTSFLLLAALAATPSGCGPAGCSPVGGPQVNWGPPPFAVPQAPPVPAWRKIAEDDWQLWQGGLCLGGYRADRDRYYARQGDTWTEAPCPYVLPADARAAAEAFRTKAKPRVEPNVGVDGVPNYGIDRAHLSPAKTYQVNGKEVSEGEARDALKLDDDSRMPFITVIGSDEQRKQVVKDLEGHPALAGLKGRWHVKEYAADDSLTAPGFVTTGSPTIYLQGPDGKVLHRQDEYRGPEKLAEAVRKADPKYDPKADPDLNKATVLPDWLGNVPGWAWGLAAAVGLGLFLPRKDVKRA